MAAECCWLKFQAKILKTSKTRQGSVIVWSVWTPFRTWWGTKSPATSDLWKTQTWQRFNLYQHFWSSLSSFSHCFWVKSRLNLIFFSFSVSSIDENWKVLCFFINVKFVLGTVDVVLSQEGFCSATSILKTDPNTQPLYWKVTNPTLSPSHLQGLSLSWCPETGKISRIN